jgi:hypothetical protein
MEHIGIHQHRTKDNPDEKVFSDMWAIANGKESLYLERLLRKDYSKYEEISQRDAHVAATIIQWLGSPVGESFRMECEDIINNGR